LCTVVIHRSNSRYSMILRDTRTPVHPGKREVRTAGENFEKFSLDMY
jgi:hypothetical protein